jgi:hypothetical protein
MPNGRYGICRKVWNFVSNWLPLHMQTNENHFSSLPNLNMKIVDHPAKYAKANSCKCDYTFQTYIFHYMCIYFIFLFAFYDLCLSLRSLFTTICCMCTSFTFHLMRMCIM